MDAQGDFKRALVKEFARRKAKNASYSLRSFARAFDISPSGMSEILNGRRGISPRMGKKIIERIGGSDPSLVLRVCDLRKRVHKKESSSESTEVLRIEKDQFDILSHWYGLAFLSLMETEGFQPDIDWVAAKLRISSRDAQRTFEKLVRLGWIEVQNRVWTLKVGPTIWGRETADIAVKRSHFENLELAERALEEVDVKEREFRHVNMAIDVDRLPEAKRRIQRFTRELCEFLEGGEKKQKVFRAAIQLFPLSD